MRYNVIILMIFSLMVSAGCTSNNSHDQIDTPKTVDLQEHYPKDLNEEEYIENAKYNKDILLNYLAAQTDDTFREKITHSEEDLASKELKTTASEVLFEYGELRAQELGLDATETPPENSQEQLQSELQEYYPNAMKMHEYTVDGHVLETVKFDSGEMIRFFYDGTLAIHYSNMDT